MSKYTYYNDSRGRRDGVVREGAAFGGSGGASPGHFDDWGYNDRNELTGQTRYNQPTSQPTTQASDGQSYAYDYDPIGNRIDYEFSQGGEPSELSYAANGLNQYDAVRFVDGNAIGQRLFYDVDGNLTHAKLMADMDCNGSVNPFDIQIFTDALDAETGCNAHPENFCDCAAADMNGDGSVNPFDIQPFVDAMSGLGGEPAVPMVRFVWDGENRLREVVPLGDTPGAGAVKWVYTYDYLGRRAAKQRFGRNSGNTGWKTTADVDVRFVNDGWNVMEELNADANADGTAGDFEVVRKYTWGLDLGGQYGSRGDRRWAGGIAGLLGMRAVAEDDDYGYLYDANGNVGQLVDLGETGATPVVVAKYEYDPYGAAVAASGTYSGSNPYRFSTKYAEGETGFYYYGYRYYSARLGRWVNRDPIQERGGWNIYVIARNNLISVIDVLGLQSETYEISETVRRALIEAAQRTKETGNEVGGRIIRNTDGTLSVENVHEGNERSVAKDQTAKDLARNGTILVGTFHTHPSELERSVPGGFAGTFSEGDITSLLGGLWGDMKILESDGCTYVLVISDKAKAERCNKDSRIPRDIFQKKYNDCRRDKGLLAPNVLPRRPKIANSCERPVLDVYCHDKARKATADECGLTYYKGCGGQTPTKQ